MTMKEPGRSKHKCIFCGQQGKLSKEHVWPNWLRAHVERTGKQNYHWVNSSGTPKKGKMARPGDAHSQTLKVVCATCNNGWMSSLQTQAKPYLELLLKDEWPTLDSDAQHVLTKWAAMFTMVNEFSDPQTAMIPQEHRSALMLRGEVSKEWSIWIGRHDPENYHPAMANHHGVKQIRIRPTTGQVFEHFIQTTGFTVGKLYVQTCMVAPPSPDVNITAGLFARAFDMRIVHPFQEHISDRPSTSHKQIEIQRISNSTVSGFGISVMEVPLSESA